MTTHIQDLIALRRRNMLLGMAALPLLSLDAVAQTQAQGPLFASVPANTDDRVTVPQGYTARTLLSWGDALFEGMPARPDFNTLTRADQEMRFGQACDMIALFPARYAFPTPRNQNRMLMCVNHEFFELSTSFPAARSPREIDAPKTEALFAAMGVTVVQLERRAGAWQVKRDARPGAGLNRRITPFTPVKFEGPAAGHRWLAAAAQGFNRGRTDVPDGAVGCGTLANCAGGQTPWGTYLTAEENFDFYFAKRGESEALSAAQGDIAWMWSAGRFGHPLFTGSGNPTYPAAYDVTQNPYGPAAYGWVVEIDPHDPTWTPRKRTALGRAKHECATTALTRDGRVAVYSGDDQIDEFIYKFVSAGAFNPRNRTANRDLLNEGQLYAAKFEADGTGRWIALTPQAANAAAADQPLVRPFTDAGDIAIRAREAARLLGATEMDRPEDVEAVLDDHWVGQGPVLVACTYNRTPHHPRPGNPVRENGPEGEAMQANFTGHILRIDEAGGDCGAETFRWDVFALGGDPAAVELATTPGTSQAFSASVNVNGAPTISGDRFACPDNLCLDRQGNAWIATDGSTDVFGDCNDQILVTPLSGAHPRPMKRFLTAPWAAEVCGPTMAPDQRAFFAAIQHPGDSDRRGNSFMQTRWSTPGARPGSSFPDGGEAWPRSSVVIVTKDDGGLIGS